VSYNDKSIVPGILIKVKKGLGSVSGYYTKPEDHFYILTEIKTKDGYEHKHDTLVFYALAEERFFPVYRWYIEESIDDGTADIVA